MTVRAGALLLVAAALVGAASAVGWLFIPALTLVLVLGVAVVVDGRRAPGPGVIAVTREMDDALAAGVKNPVHLRVQASGPASRLRIADEFPADVISDHTPADVRPPTALTYTVTPRRRGEVHFARTGVRTCGPWGLGFRYFRTGEPQTVKVDADVAVIGRYEALARRGRLAEIGARAQRRRAEGTEFERIRDAVPDDPQRFINWRATARTGHLMATEHRPERQQPVILCIDHGRLMGVGAGAQTKLDHALGAAILLAHVALKTGDRVGLFAFSDAVSARVAPNAGVPHMRRIIDAMRPLQPGEIESDYDDAFLHLSRWQRRRALVAIFTDVLDADQARALLAQCVRLRRTHLPVVITVRDPAIVDVAATAPHDSDTTFRRAVAAGLLADREAALAVLRASRVDVIDADARSLSPQLVNRYLEMKRDLRI